MTSIEQNIVGTWRSYKLFCYSGKVEAHHTGKYLELSIDRNGGLTLLHAQEKRLAVALKQGEWKIEEYKRRWFLYFGKRQAYELITVEANDLVLADPVKGEKIFFARMPEWNCRIEPAVTSIRHIQPSSEKKET